MIDDKLHYNWNAIYWALAVCITIFHPMVFALDNQSQSYFRANIPSIATFNPKPSIEDRPPKLPSLRKPDLVAWGIFVDPLGRLFIRIENHGGILSMGTATYQIFVNGRLVSERKLSSMKDKSLIYHNGQSLENTGIKLSGTERHVILVVDPHNTIDEIREDQNILFKSLNSPVVTPNYELSISDLRLSKSNNRSDPQYLEVELTNLGKQVPISGALVNFLIEVDNLPSLRIQKTLPNFGKNKSAVISFSPEVVIPPHSAVSVSLKINDPQIDFDKTNNFRQELMPIDILSYEALLAEPKIQQAVTWREGPFSYPYSQWSPNQKLHLFEAIARRESGEPPSPGQLPLASIPSDDRSPTIKIDTAWQIYLAFLANALYVEVNQLVPWSLLDLPRNQISLMLDARHIFFPTTRIEADNWDFPSDEVRFRVGREGIGFIAAWNPTLAFDFLSIGGMIKQTQTETIYALSDWMQSRMNHIADWHGDYDQDLDSDDIEAEWGLPNIPLADRMIFPAEDRANRTWGCRSTSGLYNYLLRSVNIPVEVASVNISYPDGNGGSILGGHSRPIFPSVGKTLFHSDDPYTGWAVPMLNQVDSESFFHDFPVHEEKLERLYGPYVPNVYTSGGPKVDCVNGECNDEFQQMTYYWKRDEIFRSVVQSAGPVLEAYAKYGEANVRSGILTGSFVKDYFSQNDKDDLIDILESQLLSLGNGIRETGMEILFERVDSFKHTQDTANILRAHGGKFSIKVLWDQYQTGLDWETMGFPGAEIVVHEAGADKIWDTPDDREILRQETDIDGSLYINGLDRGLYRVDLVDHTAPPASYILNNFDPDPVTDQMIDGLYWHKDIIFAFRSF